MMLDKWHPERETGFERELSLEVPDIDFDFPMDDFCMPVLVEITCGCCGKSVSPENARRYPEVDAENDMCCNDCAAANGLNIEEAEKIEY